MTSPTRHIETEKLEKDLDQLLNEYRFSRTELAKIIRAEVDDLQHGIDNLTFEQENKLANFRFHIGVFNKLLGYEDASMTADWFFKPLDDNFICSPFDLYMKEGYSGVRDIFQADSPADHLRRFYPEYRKSNQVVVPVLLGDGRVVFSVCEQNSMY